MFTCLTFVCFLSSSPVSVSIVVSLLPLVSILSLFLLLLCSSFSYLPPPSVCLSYVCLPISSFSSLPSAGSFLFWFPPTMLPPSLFCCFRSFLGRFSLPFLLLLRVFCLLSGVYALSLVVLSGVYVPYSIFSLLSLFLRCLVLASLQWMVLLGSVVPAPPIV